MRLLALVGTETEVFERLAAVFWAAEDQRVAARRRTESKLVQGDGITTSSDNASTGGSGEAEGSDGHLGEGEQSVVVSDGADHDNSALLALLVDVANNARQRDGGAVDLGHEKTAKNNLVEGRVGTTGKEAVKLYQELEIDIVALGRLAVRRLDVVAVEINTYKMKQSSAQNPCMLMQVLSLPKKRNAMPAERRQETSFHSHTEAVFRCFTYPFCRLFR